METSAEGKLSNLHSHLNIKNLTSTPLSKQVMTITEKKNVNGKFSVLRHAYGKLGWAVSFPIWCLMVWMFWSYNAKP